MSGGASGAGPGDNGGKTVVASPVGPKGGARACGVGEDWREHEARRTAGPTTPSLVLMSAMAHRLPCQPTIAGGAAPAPRGRAMWPMARQLNWTRTQRRPQARGTPGTGAPCHTPRHTPPGSSTGSRLRIVPEEMDTPEHDDENGRAEAVSGVQLIVEVRLVTRCLNVVRATGAHAGGVKTGVVVSARALDRGALIAAPTPAPHPPAAPASARHVSIPEPIVSPFAPPAATRASANLAGSIHHDAQVVGRQVRVYVSA